MRDAFDRFGPAHWSMIGAVLVLVMTAIAAARSDRWERSFRIGLAVLLGAALVMVIAHEAARGTLTLTDLLPLHLSDFAVLLAIFALLTLRQRPAELLYFLSFAEVLAIMTPDVGDELSHPRTLAFFILHGGTVAAAGFLTFGKRLIPDRGAALRALLFLNLYAAFTALVNAILGTNFLYLRAKPRQPSPLDWMGPWPWYILTAEVVAAVLFFLAGLPFRNQRLSRPERRSS